MTGKKENKQGYGKILDSWTPPEDSGDPVGCIATSFTFSPVFFEEECLSRFLKLETDPNEDGPLYLVEREEKLSQIVCAAALVDQHNCTGSRNLRWDLLSARVRGGFQHAKISLLYWTNRLRIIVASANLTEDGYRRNQEIYGILNYFNGSSSPLACLYDIISFLKTTAGYSENSEKEPSPALNRWNSFLDKTGQIPENWGAGQDEIPKDMPLVWPVFSGPGYPDVLENLSENWPGNSPPGAAFVVSPFFDPPEALNRPAHALWDTLKKRGRASVSFAVSAEDVAGEEAVFLHAPKSLLDAQPKGRRDVITDFYRVNLEASRPLHAKAIWLEGNRWLIYMIGSSNFTSAGLGLKKPGNLEANLAYAINHLKNPKTYKLMEKSFPDIELIDSNQEIKWQSRIDEDDESSKKTVLLPDAFGPAVYNIDDQHREIITLTFNHAPPTGWKVIAEDEENLFFTEEEWDSHVKPDKIILLWTEDRPPSGFFVLWENSLGRAWLPVNIASSTCLPPPQELKDLPLDVLITILTSARPLHRALGNYLKRKKTGKPGPEIPKGLVDPHTRVDTSKFLLQRSRRVSWALNAIRERIERPAVSEEGVRWRLRGPVGAMAFAEALNREAHSEEEKAFLITELALELARAKPKEAPNCFPVDKIQDEIQGVIRELKQKIPSDRLENLNNLKTYVNDVFGTILK